MIVGNTFKEIMLHLIRNFMLHLIRRTSKDVYLFVSEFFSFLLFSHVLYVSYQECENLL